MNKKLLHQNGLILFSEANFPKNKIYQYGFSMENAKIAPTCCGFNPDKVFLHSKDKKEKLVIGNYCFISPDVYFILASDHSVNHLSTFPFLVRVLEMENEALSKGDIIIKDDVFIGLNSIILSGVNIGQGAIVNAGSVVTKDIPPYAIVEGSPAKIVNYRFEPEIIKKLLQIDYSKITDKKIKLLGKNLYKEITPQNIDEILKQIL